MKIFLLSALVLTYAGTTTGQHKLKDYLVPSFYSTAGNYDNGNSSISYSGYVLFTVKKTNHIIIGYDNLTISEPSQDYNRQMFIVGEYLNFSPWIISANIAYASGNFTSNGQTNPDSEFMNIYNINFKHNTNKFYIGASYTYTNIRGVNNLELHQTGLTFDYHLNKNFSFHIQNFYSHLTDGRDLISGTFIFNFHPIEEWLLSISKSVGRKAYFFNPDNFTVFNRHETLQGSYGLKTALSFVKELDLIFSYKQYYFGDYVINYYTGGVKFNLPI